MTEQELATNIVEGWDLKELTKNSILYLTEYYIENQKEFKQEREEYEGDLR